MSDLFEKLNEQQIEAVKSTEGYYRIIAGAGSGKTRTLTHRFAYLVKEYGISARNILCVTFTNKAAGEMKSRIKTLLGDKEHENALVTTYHGFCVKVLKEDIYILFFPSNFKILDVGAQKKILDEIYTAYELKLDYSSFEKTLEYIYKEKTHLNYIPQMADPAYIFDETRGNTLEERIYIKYLAHQKKIYGLDFNDLIYYTIYLFEHHEDVLAKWRDRLHYIQVDEFQDSSKKELDIINALCKGHNNLFVVGDPDQNIYEWRYSENRFLVHFDKNYPNVKTVFLNQNYRSTPEILAVSNSLIEKNKNRVPKELFTNNDSGKKVEHIHLKNDEEEAKWLVSKIKELTGSQKNGIPVLYSDIAILYRSSYVSRFVEQSLYSESIPYLIQGGIRFFDRMEIKDCIAFLKLVANNDDEALLRVINVPARQMGKMKIEFLRNVQRNLKENYETEQSLFEILCNTVETPGTPLFNTQVREFINIITEFRKKVKENSIKISDLLNSILERTKYKEYISRNGDMERFDNVTELLSSITEFEQQLGEDISLDSYLQQLTLMSDYESEKNKNCVKLMTIHASKGLEFPYVIIVGMTEGICPSKRTIDERKEQGLEEERRLCYVAITRAMYELYIMESEGNTYGTASKLPSRFLFDIDPSYINTIGTIPEEVMKELSARTKSPYAARSSNTASTPKDGTTATGKYKFMKGDTVNHRFFGLGEVKDIDQKNDVYIIKFANLDDIKPISVNFAGITSANSDNTEIANTTTAIPTPKNTVLEKPEKTEPDNNSKISSGFSRKLDRYFESMKADERYKKKAENEENPKPFTYLIPPSLADDKSEVVESDIFDISNIDDNIADNTENTDSADKGNESIEELEIEQIEQVGIEFLEIETGQEQELETVLSTAPQISLYQAPPQILYDNSDRINLWNDSTVPKKDWICVDVIDLGYPNGQCGMCGKEQVRYIHIMKHENYPTIGAGCICAGNMEGDIEIAKERERHLKNKIVRYHTFFKSKLKVTPKGNLCISYKDTVITFLKDKRNESDWKFVEGGQFSNAFESLEEAKYAAFTKVDSRR